VRSGPLLLRLGQALQRGGEAVVPQPQVRPALGDVRGGLLHRQAFLTHQPAAQHEAGARGTAGAVHEEALALREPSTARVWMPTSFGSACAQARNRSNRSASSRPPRPTSDVATSSAICVSSVN
jgi:hypothetical protein